MKKLVICGGHLTPALALIEEIEEVKNFQIFFFGRKSATEGSSSYSAEYQIIVEKGIKFYSLVTGRLQRKFTRYTLISLLKIPLGFIQSFFYLVKIRPDLIIAFGGYLSTPVVFTGWLLGIDCVIHEQSIIPGIANRVNALFAKRIFLSFAQTQKYFPERKSLVIGNLLRRSLFEASPKSPELKNFLQRSKNLIYVTGGNQGSHFLNKLVLDNLYYFSKFDLIHQVGSTNFQGDWQKASKAKNAHYLPVKYLSSQDVGSVLKKAKLVISRSGANIVWELAAFAKVALLIPLPIAASGEQEKNARILEKAGSALIIPQADLNGQTVRIAIGRIFKTYPKFQKAAGKLQKRVHFDASQKLARFILRYT